MDEDEGDKYLVCDWCGHESQDFTTFFGDIRCDECAEDETYRREILVMTDWISVEEEMPEEGQKVWYYFQPVSEHRGTFDGYWVDENGKEWKGMHMFSCDYGF